MAEDVTQKSSVCLKNGRKRGKISSDACEISLEDFICPICLQLLIEPVVMPCQHELCKVCFTQNVQEANLQCPICRRRISSWARKQARNGSLICQERWELIQRLFPGKCERILKGEDDESDDFDYHRPLKRVLSENGAIRGEYEEEIKKIRQTREAECMASEKLISQLIKEEKNIENEMVQMIDQDEEIARKIQLQQINQPKVSTLHARPSSNVAAVNKVKKKKTSPKGPTYTLERWFSPSGKQTAEPSFKTNNSDSACSDSNAHTGIVTNFDRGSTNIFRQKKQQENEDFALALRLQKEFDNQRTEDNKPIERKKGTVDGYLLRNPIASTSSL